MVQQALEATTVKDGEMLGNKVALGESLTLDVEGDQITIPPDELILEKIDAEGLTVISNFGCTVAIDTQVTQELFLEGLMRDFIRHVQNLRKEVDFNVNDRISLYFEADGELAEAIKTHVDYISTETLSTVVENEPIPPDIHAEEIKLGRYIARIGVAK